MQTLVTGGAGFIGSHLAAGLVRRGDRPRIFDNFSSGSWANVAAIGAEVETVEGDLRDEAAVRRAMDGIEVVFHLAADPSVPRSVEDPRTCYDVNVTGTLTLLQAARDAGCRRVVFASSCAVYGDDPVLPKHETLTPWPGSPYASSKLAGEELCQVFARVYGLETVSLRFFNVYGPRQDPRGPYASVISRFVEALRRGETPTIFGDGEQTRDFVFVGDVVQAILRAASASNASGEIYNVASGRTVTLNQLLAILAGLLGREPVATFASERAGDVRHSAADISLVRKALEFEPVVSLEEGLAQTLAATAVEIPTHS